MTKQYTLFPTEIIRSFHEGLGYVRTRNWHPKGASLFIFDTQTRSSDIVQGLIEQNIARFFEAYQYSCQRKYTCSQRKEPALPTKRFLFESKDDRCRASLVHLVERGWEFDKTASYLEAMSQKKSKQNFLLRFSSPWIESPDGQVIRKRNNKTYNILVDEEASTEIRRRFLEYIR